MVHQFNDGGIALGVYISGSYAYIADRSEGIKIIDISGPFITGYNPILLLSAMVGISVILGFKRRKNF